MRVCHIIDGLPRGGAETVLRSLVLRSRVHGFEHSVLSLTTLGEVGKELRSEGVSVSALDLKSRVPTPGGFAGLVRWIRDQRADVIQTWMYNADLVAGIAGRLSTRTPVVWNVRHSNFVDGARSGAAYWSFHLCRAVSRFVPSKIVFCSQSGLDIHRRAGYPGGRSIVIPNGFDLDAFHPDPAARTSLRQELGIGSEVVLIGLVARYHPQKDHGTFVAAAKVLAQTHENVRWLLCGDGVTEQNGELSGRISAAGLADRFHLLGHRTDIPAINVALDIASTSSAFGEGFPNVLGEAMASGVPCVATDVGDSATVIGETGMVVAPKDPVALASAWERMVDMGAEAREHLGRQARSRVADRFGIDEMVTRYEELYRVVAEARRAKVGC